MNRRARDRHTAPVVTTSTRFGSLFGSTPATRVTFRPLTPRDLAHYLAAGEWDGRAGAYAIQGLGAALVERIEGLCAPSAWQRAS